MKPVHARPRPATVLAIACLCALSGLRAAQAQAVCSSDGQRAPVALMERFINADCATCWSDAHTPRPPQGTLALDWVVPGTQGEDAPLSAVASRDASARLQALARPVPPDMATLHTRAVRTARKVPAARLRVAQGPVLGGYLGASIDLHTALRPAHALSAWLVLVETLPAGTEDSPVERNLVRNVFSPAWNGLTSLSKNDFQWFESRPLSIPAGAHPERLRVIGWVQDDQGRIRAIAQSRCMLEEK